MTLEEATRFVELAALAQGHALEPGQLGRVAAVFARNAEMAELVVNFDLPEAAEPAPQFRP